MTAPWPSTVEVMTSTSSYDVNVQRIVRSSNTPFDLVVERLRRATNPNGLAESQAFVPSPNARMNKTAFLEMCHGRIGSSDFMYFYETDYGSWMGLFDVGAGQKVKRFIIGNPLIAQTIIRHDLDACLAVPVELLVKESQAGGGTEITYNLPSSLIVGPHTMGNKELAAAVGALDAKLGQLVDQVVHETNA